MKPFHTAKDVEAVGLFDCSCRVGKALNRAAATFLEHCSSDDVGAAFYNFKEMYNADPNATGVCFTDCQRGLLTFVTPTERYRGKAAKIAQIIVDEVR